MSVRSISSRECSARSSASDRSSPISASASSASARLPLAVAPGEQPPPVQRIGFSARAKTALEHALRESRAVDRLRIEPGDILHLRIVVPVAEDFRGSGRPFLQLVQQGFLGLVRAAETYGYRTGSRFSEYATAWVRQAIARFVAGPRG